MGDFMNKIRLWFWVASLLMIFNHAQVNAASFDCSKSGSYIEKCVCSNSRLSKLDDQMAELYHRALENIANPDELRKVQRNWISFRNRYAKYQSSEFSSEERLERLYENRINQLKVRYLSKPQDKLLPLELLKKFTNIDLSEHTDSDNVRFCQGFLDDVRSVKGVKSIPPTIDSLPLKSPRLHAYSMGCNSNIPTQKEFNFLSYIAYDNYSAWFISVPQLSSPVMLIYGGGSYWDAGRSSIANPPFWAYGPSVLSVLLNSECKILGHRESPYLALDENAPVFKRQAQLVRYRNSNLLLLSGNMTYPGRSKNYVIHLYDVGSNGDLVNSCSYFSH
jgi:uncharacterized protein YecT (DUF1311 family)